MRGVIEFVVGLVFGWGLLLSGMSDPGKVQGFLDLFGAWDPSLALVMGGAIAVGVFAFAVARKRTTTFVGGALRLPDERDIDKAVVVGSLIFGAGWGLAGFCPGPGVVAMAAGQPKAAAFVAAMLAGMVGYVLLERASERAAAAAAAAAGETSARED